MSDAQSNYKPLPFNPDYREGFREELSKQHDIYCNANPNITVNQRKLAYKATAERLIPQFPSIREKVHILVGLNKYDT